MKTLLKTTAIVYNTAAEADKVAAELQSFEDEFTFIVIVAASGRAIIHALDETGFDMGPFGYSN